MHLHIGLIALIVHFLEFLVIWIPVKLIAANFEGRSAVASATLHVL